LITSIFVLSPPIQNITKDELPLVIEVQKKELTVQEKISYYSSLYEIDDEIPLAIANAESQFKNICNIEKGCTAGIGIFQIVQSTFDEQCKSKGTPIMSDVYVIDDNIQCGIRMIKNGDYWRWNPSMNKWLPKLSTNVKEKIESLCSCVKGVRSFGINLPSVKSAKDLPANSTFHVGAVVLFDYPENELGHVALIVKMTPEYMIVKETNYKKCSYTERRVYYNDPNIRGFYDSNNVI